MAQTKNTEEQVEEFEISVQQCVDAFEKTLLDLVRNDKGWTAIVPALGEMVIRAAQADGEPGAILLEVVVDMLRRQTINGSWVNSPFASTATTTTQ
jgi:hypothetical protein